MSSSFDRAFDRAIAATQPRGKSAAATLTRAMRKWSEEIHRLTFNRYDRHVPLGQIHEAAQKLGFKVKEEDEFPFMLLGHDGKTSIEYVLPEAPQRNVYLHLTWHRMESGNFETVAYVSCGSATGGGSATDR